MSLQNTSALGKVGVLYPDYVKADDRNLPHVDIFMLVDFFQRLRDPAMKHIKLQRSTGENYGDDAVGYVQLKRTTGVCEVAGRITPEHRVTSKPYCVAATINEEEGEVAEARCFDCAAAAGTCKHVAAFLGWLERRSSSKSVTSTTSYWKKARLSNVTMETKKANIDSLKKKPRKSAMSASTSSPNSGSQFLEAVLLQAPPGQTGLVFSHFGRQTYVKEEIGIDSLLRSFVHCYKKVPTYDEFINHCKLKMTSEVCEEVRKETITQSKSSLWHAVRFARITASKAYDVSHSSLAPGNVLVMSVIGASKLKDTAAMERGRKLEPQVVNEVQKKVGGIVQSGIYLTANHPVMGASPDGVTADGQAIIEVKCPSSEKSHKRYVKKDGGVPAKHVAQLQMLMHMSEKNHAYFCVASPHFEQNKNVSMVRVDYDSQYCKSMIEACDVFWKRAVFQEIIKAYM